MYLQLARWIETRGHRDTRPVQDHVFSTKRESHGLAKQKHRRVVRDREFCTEEVRAGGLELERSYISYYKTGKEAIRRSVLTCYSLLGL